MKNNETNDARLTDLWNRRGRLNRQEWEDLYRLVSRGLQRPSAKINSYLLSLNDQKEDYIQEFFVQKVMATADTPAEPKQRTCNQLLYVYFTNFLKDQLDKEKREPSNPKRKDHVDAHHSQDADKADEDHGSEEDIADRTQRDPTASKTDPYTVEDPREFYFSPDRVEETFMQHNVTRKAIADSACRFFGDLADWEQQVVSRHLCAENGNALPLSTLQEQYPKTATYYKIKQLGIVHSLRSVPQDYDKTKIGRWLVKSLNVPLTLENYPLLAIALQILCLAALGLLDA